MKVTVKKKVEVNVKTLKVSAGVRYWEDATVNGVDDENGDLIPCRNGDYWEPLIDLKSGVITNWEEGKEADIHYKVCDDGNYWLLDESGNEAAKKRGYYVPEILCPNGEGFGDYIIMTVDGNGKISNWKVDLSEFPVKEI